MYEGVKTRFRANEERIHKKINRVDAGPMDVERVSDGGLGDGGFGTVLSIDQDKRKFPYRLDPGADVSVLPQSVYDMLCHTLFIPVREEPADYVLRMGNGDPVRVCKTACVDIVIFTSAGPTRLRKVECAILAGPSDEFLIGLPECNRLGLPDFPSLLAKNVAAVRRVRFDGEEKAGGEGDVVLFDCDVLDDDRRQNALDEMSPTAVPTPDALMSCIEAMFARARAEGAP